MRRTSALVALFATRTRARPRLRSAATQASPTIAPPPPPPTRGHRRDVSPTRCATSALLTLARPRSASRCARAWSQHLLAKTPDDCGAKGRLRRRGRAPASDDRAVHARPRSPTASCRRGLDADRALIWSTAARRAATRRACCRAACCCASCTRTTPASAEQYEQARATGASTSRAALSCAARALRRGPGRGLGRARAADADARGADHARAAVRRAAQRADRAVSVARTAHAAHAPRCSRACSAPR